ncbi:family 2 glycosyl transferase [Caulobacter sp. Root487D2Y]|uniref:glycosyltransferase n=1 Tax=Caulobacter sp. Root487D2Y TaxID=1736547 RepID=UPI0006F68923|nr:glycosyltransferase [Caulobacter sp. Root487D2Y]KQY30086.1 family 2 glycosyl transferase [Caulobacter sp. Root487D2Y]
MAREERDQRRRAFGTEAADGSWIEALADGPDATATPLRDGAHRRLSRGQVVGLSTFVLALLVLTALRPQPMLEGFHLLFFVGFMGHSTIKLVAAFTPRATTVAPPLPDEALPAYTIIAPLYREAGVAAELVANLARLDYPRDRLQVLIVLEARDHETQTAFGALDLPAGFQVLIAPPGSPQTKPRACNIALQRAHGELVVIYDAEDAPHPGQLREAAARFAQADASLACLQAPLRIEPDPRFLPDQFALEYAVLFEVFLPALARWRLPFPLGGTSNHFRASALRAVGGWDPYNVTEDADIGFRLAAQGRQLDVLAQPTFETSPATLKVWTPQRARWIKGHLQTLAVHARGPAARTPRGAASLVLTLALPVMSSHVHGPLFAWLLLQGVGAGLDLCPAVPAMDWMLMFFGWTCIAIAGAQAQRRAGHRQRPLPLLGAIAYWPLQSLAAAEALRQFVVSPFHWDKTPHTPRAANPLLSRLLARTGRALP